MSLNFSFLRKKKMFPLDSAIKSLAGLVAVLNKSKLVKNVFIFWRISSALNRFQRSWTHLRTFSHGCTKNFLEDPIPFTKGCNSMIQDFHAHLFLFCKYFFRYFEKSKIPRSPFSTYRSAATKRLTKENIFFIFFFSKKMSPSSSWYLQYIVIPRRLLETSCFIHLGGMAIWNTSNISHVCDLSFPRLDPKNLQTHLSTRSFKNANLHWSRRRRGKGERGGRKSLKFEHATRYRSCIPLAPRVKE